jgi:hypothetical protein
MSNTRTRRTSDAPATRAPPGTSHASGGASRYRDDYTANNAPEWQSNFHRSSVNKSRAQEDDDYKSAIAFRAPPVAPLDSVSVASPRGRENGRLYKAIPTAPPSRRPPLKQRSSSVEGTSWSGSGAPLTETNVRFLNKRGSSMRSSKVKVYDADKSRWTSRRPSEAMGGEVEERTAAQQTTRSSRRRATVTGEDYEYGNGEKTKSGWQSEARSARKSSVRETEVGGAGAAAGAVGAVAAQSGAGSRAETRAKDDGAVGTRVSRRTSRAPQTEAVTTTQDRQVSTRTTNGRRSRASSSSSSSSSSSTERMQRPTAPTDPFSPRSATSASSASPPANMEWEKRVYIREYRRPSDGKWVESRECIVRKIIPPQPPQTSQVTANA